MQDNYLNRDEMLAALQEVGVFNGIRANKVGEFHGLAVGASRLGVYPQQCLTAQQAVPLRTMGPPCKRNKPSPHEKLVHCMYATL